MKYNNKEVVYIEYQDNKPFSVRVADLGKGYVDSYDFETDCTECELFMHYNSESGGLATEIQAPKYADKCEVSCTYWLHPQAKLEGSPVNAKKIDSPIEIKGSRNPFDNSREIFELRYCKICNKYLDEDWCEHLVEDDEGNVCYTNED